MHGSVLSVQVLQVQDLQPPGQKLIQVQMRVEHNTAVSEVAKYDGYSEFNENFNV